MKSLMRNTAVTLAVLGSVGIVGTGMAHAQDDTKAVERPYRIKVGGFFPTEGDVKDAYGSTFFSGGVSWDFSKTLATNPTVFTLYTDYTRGERGDNTLGIWGLGVGARFLFAPANSSGQPYGELGLGYYNVDFSPGPSAGRVGGKLGLGYQLNQGLFGEVEYNLIDKVEGVNPSGVRLNVGYRF